MSKKIDINKIAKIDWLSRWAGSYTFISCSHWEPQYYYSLKKVLGINFSYVLFFHSKGTVSFFISNDEFKNFGLKLAAKSLKNINYAKKLCTDLERNTDIILPLMKKMKTKIPSDKEYENFLFYFNRHLAYHNFVKKTVDFFTPKDSKRLLPYFLKARKYSESVYSESEVFFRKLAKLISKETGYDADLLTCLTQKEFELFISSRILPSKSILIARYNNSALYFEHGEEFILTGGEARKVQLIINKQDQLNQKELKGIKVYPGQVVSIARIILDPHKKHVFNQGDILVTGMTRPEFMPYIKKASALITDVGGILCHAAITAREFKIPCVVGTINATKYLKDGQKIKVDADQGIIINY